ncbi:hypothetical protein, partial [Streptomyces sp. bgisy159]|uniref:hypothetical protein n=1 Tax=Streptomyces sp. bgisy159 TaxID=3413795 RepID=UPI003F4A6A9C
MVCHTSGEVVAQPGAGARQVAAGVDGGQVAAGVDGRGRGDVLAESAHVVQAAAQVDVLHGLGSVRGRARHRRFP